MASTAYIPKGVCSKGIYIETEGDTITRVKFAGGCDGNLKAISKLVAGQKIDDVADLLEGNTCNARPTSCADQLAKALRTIEK